VVQPFLDPGQLQPPARVSRPRVTVRHHAEEAPGPPRGPVRSRGLASSTASAGTIPAWSWAQHRSEPRMVTSSRTVAAAAPRSSAWTRQEERPECGLRAGPEDAPVRSGAGAVGFETGRRRGPLPLSPAPAPQPEVPNARPDRKRMPTGEVPPAAPPHGSEPPQGLHLPLEAARAPLGRNVRKRCSDRGTAAVSRARTASPPRLRAKVSGSSPSGSSATRVDAPPARSAAPAAPPPSGPPRRRRGAAGAPVRPLAGAAGGAPG
jgi:hypothetical protein